MKHEKKCRQNIVTAVCITLLAAGLTGTVLGLLLANGDSARPPARPAMRSPEVRSPATLASRPTRRSYPQIKSRRRSSAIECTCLPVPACSTSISRSVSTPTPGNVFSGGRYLFDTAEHAREYRDWVFNTYVLDGVLFLKRSYFLSPECHAWTVIGAHDFGDIHSSQIVLRTERWSLRNARQPAWVLEQKFDAILAAAQARGLTSVWLLYDPEEALASLVYFAGRAGPSDPRMPDMASLSVLADAPPLGEIFDDQGWKRTFDRTQWALTIWFPFALGDRGEPALWPNTPPFYLPSESDGVCEVSRGESALNAPLNVRRHVETASLRADETSMNCPGDVRLFQ